MTGLPKRQALFLWILPYCFLPQFWYYYIRNTETTQKENGKATEPERDTMKYSVTKIFADGVERKRTLADIAREIERDNPNEIVEITSQKTGRIWCGRAKNITADLTQSYIKRCVQDISEDEYGTTLFMR